MLLKRSLKLLNKSLVTFYLNETIEPFIFYKAQEA
jgi:hypothetical protein